MRLVVDASALVPCFVRQQSAPVSLDLLAEEHTLLSPDFLLIEIANVFWKLCRRGELDLAGADAGMDEVMNGAVEFIATTPLLQRARAIAAALNHAVYDCLYLAAAETVQAPVVTADRRLFDRASAGGWRDHVLWIEDLPPIRSDAYRPDTIHGRRCARKMAGRS